MDQSSISQELFTAKATTGVSKAHLVQDFRNIVIHVTSAASTTATVKVKAALVDGVDFAAASSVSNPWFWVATTPLDTGSSPVDGNTGYSSSASYLNKCVELETNLIRWFALEITAISAGSVSAYFIAKNNA
jgi:hypothetical protein